MTVRWKTKIVESRCSGARTLLFALCHAWLYSSFESWENSSVWMRLIVLFEKFLKRNKWNFWISLNLVSVNQNLLQNVWLSAYLVGNSAVCVRVKSWSSMRSPSSVVPLVIGQEIRFNGVQTWWLFRSFAAVNMLLNWVFFFFAEVTSKSFSTGWSGAFLDRRPRQF